MLLQMPILVALFMFFPSAIELRHQSFLWAHDLSTYDAIVSWNTYIPIITPYFGNHISLFCLLMTVTNIIYTKFNMDQTNTGQQQMRNEGDDVHDAADDVGILQSVCIRFDLLLLHLHIDHDFADCNFPLYD